MPNSDEAARAAVRQAVNDELVKTGMTPAELARRADVDSDTVNDFLSGKRWPQSGTRGKVSEALGWGRIGIERIFRGESVPSIDAETVSRPDLDRGVLLSMPPEALEGLGPAEREEVIAAAKLSALRAAREIRRRLDEEQDR